MTKKLKLLLGFIAVLQVILIALLLNGAALLGNVQESTNRIDNQLTNVATDTAALKSVETKPDLESIRRTIAAALPNTPIRSVMPAPIDGLYEVTNSKGLMYTDATGRYLFVGGIYDPKTNTDLVKARKEELGFVESKTKPATAQTQQAPAPEYVTLPPSAAKEVDQYAITYQFKPGAPVVYELFDPMCGFCRKNHDALKSLNVTVKKLLTVSQGSREINEQVYCADDPIAAIDSLLTNNTLTTTGKPRTGCNVADLDEITQWRTKHGIPGLTPFTLVENNHRLYRGYVPAATWAARLGQ